MRLPEAMEVSANDVVVAWVRRVEPRSVVDPKMFATVELSCPWKVEDAVTERLEVVAPLKERLRPVTSPVFEMVKRVVVANVGLEEEIWKSVVVLKVEDATKSERTAVGEEVPIPTLPFERNVVVAAPPKYAMVEENCEEVA